MKKLIYTILIVLFSVSLSFAADSLEVADKGEPVSGNSVLRTLTLTMTADTDGSFSEQLTTSMFDHIKGWVLVKVRLSNSATQTDWTADSDLYFRLEASGALDLLNGAGVNNVDPDTVNSIEPLDTAGDPNVMFVVDQFFIEVENNSVNGSELTLMLICFPAK